MPKTKKYTIRYEYHPDEVDCWDAWHPEHGRLACVAVGKTKKQARKRLASATRAHDSVITNYTPIMNSDPNQDPEVDGE